MNKNSFKKSQVQHERLAKKHSRMYEKNEKGIHWICSGYHNNVMRKQASLGRILTLEEKKKVFRNCEYYFYN